MYTTYGKLISGLFYVLRALHKAASDAYRLTVYPRPNGDGEVSLLHWKRAATDRFFLFRMTKPGVTLTGEMCLWEDETPIGTGLPMLFDFLDEVRILK